MNQTEGWAEFPIQYKIMEILKYGDLFPKKIIIGIHNTFWRDMVKSIIKMHEIMKFNKWIQIQHMPLWHNSLIYIEYRLDWEGKGYHTLNDILNDEGELKTREEMNEASLNIHFLDYFRLNQSVNKLIQKNETHNKISGPCLPRIVFEIGLNDKGCSKTYNKLMEYNGNIIKEVKEKWEEVLNEDIRYKTIQTAFKVLPTLKVSAYQKYLQFKLLHSRTAISEKLYNMKISETNLCPLCHNEVETIKHAFLECISVTSFWLQIEKWFKIKTKKIVKLSTIDKIFGMQSSDNLLDKIILNAKIIIFSNRKNGKNHTISDLKRKMFKQLHIEKYQAKMDQNEDKLIELLELYAAFS